MNINDKIDSLEDTKASKAFKEFLKEYIKPAYGAMSKRDFDIMLFMALQKLDVIAETPEIYDVVSSLKVTRAKARNLIYESKLRTSTENDLKDELRGLISSPILKDGDKVSLEIGNPYLVDYIRSELKRLGHITDGSFSNEILKMTVNAYTDLFVSLISESKDKIEKALIACGAKTDTSIQGVIKSIITEFGKKVAGKVGEELVGDLTTDYLSPIMKSTIDTTASALKNFVTKHFGSSDSN